MQSAAQTVCWLTTRYLFKRDQMAAAVAKSKTASKALVSQVHCVKLLSVKIKERKKQNPNAIQPTYSKRFDIPESHIASTNVVPNKKVSTTFTVPTIIEIKVITISKKT